MFTLVIFFGFLGAAVFGAAAVERYAKATWRRWALWGMVGALLGVSVVVFRYSPDTHLLIAALCGTLVGGTEVLSRYRDEPFLALVANPYGPAYVAINGLISAFAYGLLDVFGEKLLPGLQESPLSRALVAGFGSSFVMRSRFFSIKTSAGDDQSVGPDAVVHVLLKCVDRGIDRSRSKLRIERASVTAQQIDRAFTSNTINFVRSTIPSFQNLTEQEKKELDTTIGSLANKPSSDPRLNIQEVFLAYLNISGEQAFDAMILSLMNYLRSLPHSEPVQHPIQRVCAAAQKIDRGHKAVTINFVRSTIPFFDNLDEQEKRDFDTIIQSLANKASPDPRLNLQEVFLAYLNISGEQAFDAMIVSLLEYLEDFPKPGEAGTDPVSPEDHKPDADHPRPTPNPDDPTRHS